MSRTDDLRALVDAAEPSERPALAAELARALADVLARCATPPTPAAAPDMPAKLLTIEEAAARLNVPVTWLYRHNKRLPFTRTMGHRTLRFDAAGLERWLVSQQRGKAA